MSDKIQQYNVRLIKWLNDSYDNKGETSDLLWSLRPIVFLGLITRLALIVIKVFLKKFKTLIGSFKKRAVEAEESSTDNIQPDEIFNISFLNLLLYRKKYNFRNKQYYSPTHKLPVTKIKKGQLSFPSSTNPLVSIIIPVFNKLEYTYNCLTSIKKQVSSTISYEVIVVNDNSSDHTKEILESIKGLTLLNNKENLGFILSCNNGASIAKGKYLCFLNNDIEVLPNWLESLVEIFNTTPNAGLVGSMLLYPNNQLQEAGSIVWNDATARNYGKFQNFIDPKYNFVKPVDYCSAASILIQRDDFEKLGGFEKNFVPAYYEDTDLCFAVRNILNKKVIYQPASKVLHDEGISSGTSTSTGIKRYQEINLDKFKKKWQDSLSTHLPFDSSHLDKASVRLCGKKTILIVDSYIPMFDKESGAYRMFQLIQILKKNNYHVIFVPDSEIPEEPYTYKLQQLGVEVLYNTEDYKVSLVSQLESRLSRIDYAWVCRPMIASKYIPLLRKNPQIKIIYDTIDLHYLRLKRETEIHPERAAQINWKEMLESEQKNVQQSDLTIAITDIDKNIILKELGDCTIETIPNIHVPYTKEIPSFEDRHGILFIGGYKHKPNIDAVKWLCNEIMPLVWEKLPGIPVTLLGSNPTPKVLKLAGPNVLIPGFIDDISPYFLKNKLFVAPLTYGAGMKGKIGQSMEYSLPVVSTPIGVEGMNLRHEYNCLIAESAADFAKEIIRLYSAKELWVNLSSKCHEAIFPFSPQHTETKIIKLLDQLNNENIIQGDPLTTIK